MSSLHAQILQSSLLCPQVRHRETNVVAILTSGLDGIEPQGCQNPKRFGYDTDVTCGPHEDEPQRIDPVKTSIALST